MSKGLNVISVCDGISCGLKALLQAHLPIKSYYAFEIDKYALAVSRYHFSDIITYCGDLRNWRKNTLPAPDLIIGGTPCQDLSIANTRGRKGLAGNKSKLFYEFAAMVRELKPQWFLLENVANMGHKYKEIITDTLGVEPRKRNSALVSAQYRSRLYWTNMPFVKLPLNKNKVLSDILENVEIDRLKNYELPATYSEVSLTDIKSNNHHLVPERIGCCKGNMQGYRIYSVKGKSVCIAASCGGPGRATGLYKIDLPNRDYIIRRLTPVECERLQTLPDNYTLYGNFEDGKIKVISDTQRYKMLGNAFTVNIVEHLLSPLRAYYEL